MSSFGGNIYTLSLCPAIDTTLYLEEIGLDRELPVHREHSEAGGKGANTAAALAVQGVDCACICLMGEENAGLFLHLLDDAGVRCVPIPLPGRIRENLSLETPQGQYRVMRQGFRADRRALGRLEMVLRERLRPGDTVLVGGKLPEGIAADDLAALCERIHSLGAEVTLDTAAVRLAQVERIRPLVIKPNRLELGEITGLPTGDLNQCVEAARLLHQHGAQRVLVSLDRDGAFLLDQEGLLLAQAPEVEVRSPVGAGDAMLAWFTAALLAGCTREEALCRAVAAGSAACLHYGTHAPSREEVEALLSQVRAVPAGHPLG